MEWNEDVGVVLGAHAERGAYSEERTISVRTIGRSPCEVLRDIPEFVQLRYHVGDQVRGILGPHLYSFM